MELSDFLSRLQVMSGPNGDGEYMCRCPAHDDRNASLCVRDGDKGIVLKCQAGCSTDMVLQSMGLKMRDLFRDGGKIVDKPVKHVEKDKKEAAQPKTIDKVYSYTDEAGKILFEVVRYVPKDFRQRVPDPAAKGGYRWSIKGVRPVIYRLPEVTQAIKDGRPIYVVEGEKDADNMALLGYTATTCPMGAGKWRSDHSAFLTGADVCIVPDNDDPGREHAAKVARAIVSVAKSVRVLDIASQCEQLPEKGDITDFFKLLGQSSGRAALEQLVKSTALYEISSDDIREQTVDLYSKVGGYCVDNGCICQNTDEGPRKLCTFTALPSKIITKDDGVNVDKVFQIDGWTRSGRQLPQVVVNAAKFPTMGWVLENWDFAANIMPGNTIKDKLRYVITEVGEMHAQRETVYTHMGWRKIGQKWVYLYPGGAVGQEGVRVELDSALTGYTLDGGEDEDLTTACALSFMFREAMAAHVSIPLMGLAFLTPLREFLAQGGYSPRFAMFLLGGTGTHKSTASQLALSYFGAFSIDMLPASFHDTANSIRKKAFILKDALLAVDDYHPETSMQERRRMEATAQSLARAFGDGADRGRMKADLSLQEATPPRGMALMSGEDMPNIGESGTARFYVINVGKDDIAITDELEAAQEMAKRGYMRRAMRGYIEWLAQRAPSLPARLPEIYVKLRKRAIKQGGGMHGRSAEAVAHIMLGYEMMLNYMADMDAISQEQADNEFHAAWDIIMANSEKQGRDAQEDRPSRMFLAAVSELLLSKAVSVKDLTVPDAPDPGPGMVGYVDGLHYYLMPDMIFTRVSKMYADQGMAFPLTKRMLYKQMRDDGVIRCAMDGKATKPKHVGGKVVRLLWIDRAMIDGPKEQQSKPDEQVAFDGFTEVHDEDMPF